MHAPFHDGGSCQQVSISQSVSEHLRVSQSVSEYLRVSQNISVVCASSTPNRRHINQVSGNERHDVVRDIARTIMLVAKHGSSPLSPSVLKSAWRQLIGLLGTGVRSAAEAEHQDGENAPRAAAIELGRQAVMLIVNDVVSPRLQTIVAEDRETQVRGCFLVFVPTIREIRYFYREM
eukprot:SAG31_NODE_10238_length_1166_cov_1.098407_1_plen_177_part_00